ncbi:dTMP kinase [Candidatus Nanobsidianus stetteri]|uniref:Probable thymidylate kinase n=1 Tax=Nanobsidianus stetteri TaxID=1294122 RepID=A0A2T9WL97_NANST|nr:dTMP kinase [Candidatus Nanobsidianus stetteri]MCC5447230.1 dTMP kinase [Candidatus Nanobsidianus stetteri]
MIKKYRYIAIEGIDGSGKTTIANLLYNELSKRYDKIILVKEPYDNDLSKKIKEIILKEHEKNLDYGYLLALLFTADRSIKNIDLKKYLNDDYIVISDRSIYSTFSYQILYEGIDIEWLKCVSKYIIRPDITFILDVDPKIAVERVNSRGKNITSYENIEFLRKVRENFLKLKEIFPEDNIIYIDGEEKPEEILKKILSIIEK